MIETETRIRALLTVLVLATLSVVIGCGPPAGPRRIFLITIDTLRADHLGLYGYPRNVSPFLDSLGKSGQVFETAYSSCSHTAPSHASLFTGLQPAQHRVLRNGEALPTDLLTLAQLLRNQGYRTAGFTTVSFLKELSAGFDDFHNKTRYFPAKTILGDAMEWIRFQPKGDQLFVWIHLFDVHEWIREDHLDEESVREIRQIGSPAGPELLTYLEREHGTRFRDDAKVIDAVDRYDGQLLSTDRQLQQFHESLKAEGLDRDALWIVTSDHGEGLGNHDYLGHGMTIYEEQVRVPLIMHFTDRRYAPRRIPGLVRLVDIAPTLAEMTGSSLNAQVMPTMGRSLLPLLQSSTASSGVRGAFCQRRPADEMRLAQGWTPGDVFGLRTERYKVIAHSEGQHEIFDLKEDPFEFNNLFPETPTEAEHLLEDLIRGFRAMSAQGEQLGTGTINPEYVDELRALGYL